MKSTTKLYGDLQRAFDHFNAELFDGELPDALLTVQRKRGAYGYFWAGVFRGIDDREQKLDEIALNPDYFARADARAKVLSILVHEMAHHWQQHFGKPGKGGYHNVQWVKKMKAIGLEPCSKNGKGTGKCVTHSIIEDGPFARSLDRLDGVDIAWASMPEQRATKNTRKKLECPSCGQGIWGTARNEIKCGLCDVLMEAEE